MTSTRAGKCRMCAGSCALIRQRHGSGGRPTPGGGDRVHSVAPGQPLGRCEQSYSAGTLGAHRPAEVVNLSPFFQVTYALAKVTLSLFEAVDQIVSVGGSELPPPRYSRNLTQRPRMAHAQSDGRLDLKSVDSAESNGFSRPECAGIAQRPSRKRRDRRTLWPASRPRSARSPRGADLLDELRRPPSHCRAVGIRTRSDPAEAVRAPDSRVRTRAKILKNASLVFASS